MTVLVGVLIAVAVFLVVVAASAIRILREYERGVIFRLGRLIDQKGPGLILLVPIIDRMVRVDLRTVTLNIPPQEVITHDNVPARVNAVAYFRVVDANDAVVEVEDYLTATSQISQTTLRSVLGKADLDTLLAERDRLNADLQRIIDERTAPWGHQGLDRRDQGRRDSRADAAGDGPPSRGRARAPSGSSTPRASSRPRRNLRRQRTSSAATQRRCSFAISRPSATSASIRTPPSSFRCPSI